jgi:hypothetical protein
VTVNWWMPQANSWMCARARAYNDDNPRATQHGRQLMAGHVRTVVNKTRDSNLWSVPDFIDTDLGCQVG